MLTLASTSITLGRWVTKFLLGIKQLISWLRESIFLSITNIGDPEFKIDRFIVSLLAELSSSLNVGFSAKRFFIPNEFTSFYRALNKMVCTNLLPSKFFAKIGILHGNILYYIEKRVTFDVGSLIQNDFINQSHIINPRIGLLYESLIIELILTTGVQSICDFDTFWLISDFKKSTISISYA